MNINRPNALTNDQFINLAKKKHGDKYDYSQANYINNTTKVVIICPIHGLFHQIPKDHLKGCGCRSCGYTYLSNKNALSQEEFIRRSSLIHHNKYDYALVNYKNYNSRVIIICPVHGKFEQLAHNHLNGNGCYKCAFSYDFLQRAKEVHGEFYDYSKIRYKGNKEKILIKCPIHGDFLQSPRDHIAGSGCRLCGNDKTSKIISSTTEEFINKARNTHGDIYDYSISKYIGATTNVTILCNTHGEFNQLPNNHIRGAGCPQCALNSRKLSFYDFLKRAKNVHNNKYKYVEESYEKSNSKIDIICPKHGKFSQNAGDHLSGHGCLLCPTIISNGHQEVIDFIKEKTDIDFTINDRKKINPYEIDIFFQSINLGIEYHGMRWHSFDRPETLKEKYKHYKKYEVCRDNGIRLIQFWESEWFLHREIVKSMILYNLGISDKVYARKCQVINLSSNDFDNFMENNHLQGTISTKYRYGLLYNEHLVSAIGFNRHLKYDYEITRLASRTGLQVIGGPSKLIKAFIRQNSSKSILTYANRRYSNGNVYSKLGFNCVNVTPPNYFYTKQRKIFNRISFQKHKLIQRLERFDPLLSESQNMFNNGYRRIWDAGNYKFLMR